MDFAVKLLAASLCNHYASPVPKVLQKFKKNGDVMLATFLQWLSSVG